MRTARFGKLISYDIGGGWGNEQPLEGDIPIRVIRGADFPAASQGLTDECPVRFDSLISTGKRTLKTGDIILEISGGTRERPTGRTVYVSDRLLRGFEETLIPASFCRLLRPNPKLVYPKWLYFHLQNLWNQGVTWEYQNQSTGISNFQYRMFAENHEVHLPHLGEQQAVAEVLGALDDKIAANSRVIEVADELQSTLAKRLMLASSGGVVGKHNESLIDGPTAIVDQKGIVGEAGVRRANLGDVLTLKNGSSSPPRIAEGKYEVLGANGLLGRADVSNVSHSCIVIGRVGSAGSVHFSSEACWVTDNAIIAYAENLKATLFWFYVLQTLNLPKRSHGSSHPLLNQGILAEIEVPVPSEEAMASFDQETANLWALTSALQKENIALARTRDELLPLLMSGRMKARDAQARVEEVAL